MRKEAMQHSQQLCNIFLFFKICLPFQTDLQDIHEEDTERQTLRLEGLGDSSLHDKGQWQLSIEAQSF
jgi:hypothetical protein